MAVSAASHRNSGASSMNDEGSGYISPRFIALWKLLFGVKKEEGKLPLDNLGLRSLSMVVQLVIEIIKNECILIIIIYF